jgi:hypothetical protein
MAARSRSLCSPALRLVAAGVVSFGVAPSAGASEGSRVPANVTIARLGRAAPSVGESDGKQVSSAPIVLWSDHGPPAVLISSLWTASVYDERTEVSGTPVVWRAVGDAVTVALSLKTSDMTEPAEEQARFYVVRATR